MLPFPEKRVGKFLLISAQNSGKHNHHLQRGLWCEFLLNLTLRAEGVESLQEKPPSHLIFAPHVSP